MKFVVLGALVAAAAATPVLAQESQATFSGPRIEARVGWDGPEVRATVSDGTDQISRSAGKSGVGYGGEIGYDFDLRGAVVGGYAGLEDSSAKECLEIYGNDRGCLRADRNITVGVRAGVRVQDQFLLYAKGGYSNGRASIDYQDYDLELADVNEGRSFDGFHAGAGFEGAFGRHVYGRLEYVYSRYDGVGLADGDLSLRLKPSRHQVVYGFGYRF
jgi:outer membrane immunogenic protein